MAYDEREFLNGLAAGLTATAGIDALANLADGWAKIVYDVRVRIYDTVHVNIFHGGRTVFVDWGDGSPLETFTDRYSISEYSHPYQGGDYSIVLLSNGLMHPWTHGLQSGIYGDHDADYRRDTLLGAYLEGNVSLIPYHAFYYCRYLASVTIPDGVTSIEREAFRGCSSLTSVTIPGSVTSIGANAFDTCRALTSLTIRDGVTSIGFQAFCGCSSLASVTIPGSVTSIGSGAFLNCSSLASVTIPDSAISIGESAFANCRALTSVTISRNASVGSNAFPSGCVINYYE